MSGFVGRLLMKEVPVRREEMELEVGDVLRIGDCTLTLIDLEDAEATFRVDDVQDEVNDTHRIVLPR